MKDSNVHPLQELSKKLTKLVFIYTIFSVVIAIAIFITGKLPTAEGVSQESIIQAFIVGQVFHIILGGIAYLFMKKEIYSWFFIAISFAVIIYVRFYFDELIILVA